MRDDSSTSSALSDRPVNSARLGLTSRREQFSEEGAILIELLSGETLREISDHRQRQSEIGAPRPGLQISTATNGTCFGEVPALVDDGHRLILLPTTLAFQLLANAALGAFLKATHGILMIADTQDIRHDLSVMREEVLGLLAQSQAQH